ncbi:hypothetical protein GDO78_010223 [Eleutherodactylus coqui]|uniref:Uncharacterized protein n=1 Tax=Eleutherodactylus coqui TaxID=57060 RepID=A0A8J6F5S4_ELECQ|nr:hypothetical protein GDO78_010223 [Eleutherodactylus coqui]
MRQILLFQKTKICLKSEDIQLFCCPSWRSSLYLSKQYVRRATQPGIFKLLSSLVASNMNSEACLTLIAVDKNLRVDKSSAGSSLVTLFLGFAGS